MSQTLKLQNNVTGGRFKNVHLLMDYNILKGFKWKLFYENILHNILHIRVFISQ